MSRAGTRLDRALAARGLAASRERAKALVRAGGVTVNGVPVLKSSRTVLPDDVLALDKPDYPWVSRAALKLTHGLAHFGLDPAGKTALDVGASTGGFTQVLRDKGAAHVVAVDVGRGQLAPEVREDPGVTSLEGVNARELGPGLVPEKVDMIVSDVSFISLEKALPAALDLAAPGGELLALVKPQFEVGKAGLGKGGVVKDPGLHRQVRARIADWLNDLPGWRVEGWTESPITGTAGNREFLMAGRFDG